MPRENSFGHKIRSCLPADLPVTDGATEKSLLQRLTEELTDSDYLETLWQLAWFYSGIQRNDVAARIIHIIMESTDDTEQRARAFHWVGQVTELQREYDAALEYYAQGLALRPTDKTTAYFLRNNSGYCLNLKGRYTEAEALCREAIEIDSARHNAWKNLGLSLEGQGGDVVGAAWAYVEATKLNPRDARAFTFLQRLIAEHPELRARFSGILEDEAACKEAIETEMRNQPRLPYPTYEICRLKYVPGCGYFELRDDAERLISSEALEQLYTVQALLMLDNHPNIWVAIVAEDSEGKSQARKHQTPTFKSRLDFAPCLVIESQLLERLKKN